MTRSHQDPERGRSDAGTPLRDREIKDQPGTRIFVRGPWEMAAGAMIGIGVFMLMQPFAMWAYTWSFLVTLVGTVMFIVVSHFPE